MYSFPSPIATVKLVFSQDVQHTILYVCVKSGDADIEKSSCSSVACFFSWATIVDTMRSKNIDFVFITEILPPHRHNIVDGGHTDTWPLW